jgi:uncharacterized protein YbjT (DUF2867 family)
MSHHQEALLAVGMTGGIGQHVIEEAVHHGCRVRALVRDRLNRQEWSPDVEVVVGELTRQNSPAHAVTGVDAAVFAHGAPYGDIQGAEAVVGADTTILVRAATELRARFKESTAVPVSRSDSPY